MYCYDMKYATLTNYPIASIIIEKIESYGYTTTFIDWNNDGLIIEMRKSQSQHGTAFRLMFNIDSVTFFTGHTSFSISYHDSKIEEKLQSAVVEIIQFMRFDATLWDVETDAHNG